MELNYLVENGKVYLAVHSNVWMNFETILKDFLTEENIAFKEKYLRLKGEDVLGARNVDDESSVWISTKHSLAEICKTLIHEAIGYHYEEHEIINGKEPEDEIEKITEEIWKKKSYRNLLKENVRYLMNGSKAEARQEKENLNTAFSFIIMKKDALRSHSCFDSHNHR